MATQYYFPAIIVRVPHGPTYAYSVRFPDVPEAITWGNSLGEAVTSARDALALALEDKTEIPEPSGIEQAWESMTQDERATATPIQLIPWTAPEQTVRINVTMPGDLLKRIDAAAGNYGRSEYLALAAREKLAREGTATIPVIQSRGFEHHLNATMGAIAKGVPMQLDENGAPFEATLKRSTTKINLKAAKETAARMRPVRFGQKKGET